MFLLPNAPDASALATPTQSTAIPPTTRPDKTSPLAFVSDSILETAIAIDLAPAQPTTRLETTLRWQTRPADCAASSSVNAPENRPQPARVFVHVDYCHVSDGSSASTGPIPAASSRRYRTHEHSPASLTPTMSFGI